MKPGLNPQALDAKLREIDLDFQQTDWPEPIEVVRFRRSDGSEGLLATTAGDLELEPERIDDWARPSRRGDADHWSEQTTRRAESTRVPRHRRPIWPVAVGLGLVLLGTAFWAYAAIPGLLRLGAPDEYGVVCYAFDKYNAVALSCVKVGLQVKT